MQARQEFHQNGLSHLITVTHRDTEAEVKPTHLCAELASAETGLNGTLSMREWFEPMRERAHSSVQ